MNEVVKAAYLSTISDPAIDWKNGPPAPILPKEEGNWALVGAPTTITIDGYHRLVWTWIDLDTAIKQAVHVGASLAQADIEAEFGEREEGCTCDPQRRINEFGHHSSCQLSTMNVG